MKVETIDARECRCCNQLVAEDDSDGLEVHGYDTVTPAYRCGECMEVYASRIEARECCR